MFQKWTSGGADGAIEGQVPFLWTGTEYSGIEVGKMDAFQRFGSIEPAEVDKLEGTARLL